MEHLRLQFKCGQTGKPFTVNLVRRQGEKEYVFQSATKGVPLASLGGSQDRQSGPVEFPADQILWIGFSCPYGCQPSPDTVALQCPCGGLSCSGGLKKSPSGTPYSKCPWCGRTFEIGGTIEKVAASRVEAGRLGLSQGESGPQLGNQSPGYLPPGRQ
jgi:hypothetical protein